jgi:hypothetical protein
MVSQLGGGAYAVFLDRPYAYIGEGPRLTILDTTNPAMPTRVGQTAPLPDVVFDIQVVDGYAYLASAVEGLVIVDVHDPAQPIAISHQDMRGEAISVQIHNNQAYVATDWGGLQAVDVSDPFNPTGVYTYYAPSASYISDIYIDGDIAYTADGYYNTDLVNTGMAVLDISGFYEPTELGHYHTGSEDQAVYAIGGMAYVAGEDFTIIDVTDPTSPTLAGRYSHGRYDVYVSQGTAYLADGGDGLRMVDVRDPATPTEIGRYDSPGEVRHLALDGNTAYVADGFYGGLRTVDVSTPPTLTEMGAYEHFPSVIDVHVRDDTAYLIDSKSLRVIDVRDPANPVEIGACETPVFATGVYVSGGIAYVADDDYHDGGLRIIDVNDPTYPVQIGHYDASDIGDVYVKGPLAYVVGGYHEHLTTDLQIVDVHNLAMPEPLGYYRSDHSEFLAESVYVNRDMAYLVGKGGMEILDISDSANPILQGTYTMSDWAYSVHVYEDLAYVVGGYNGLHIVDVSNPVSPTRVHLHATPAFDHDVYVSGGVAYVVSGDLHDDDGLRVIDVRDPQNPAVLGYYDTPGWANGVHISNGLAYVANGAAGFTILQSTNAPATYAVTGRVTKDDGTPIQGVAIADSRGQVATTDAMGRYWLSDFITGTYTLTPSKRHYIFTPASRTVSVPPEPSAVDFTGTFQPSCTPYLTDVAIVGPTSGHTDAPLRLMAFPTPQDAALPITYTWDFGDGTFGAGQVVTHTYSVSGTHTVSLQAANCVDVHDAWTVAITPPPPAALGDAYETDDTCAQAQVISPTGMAQVHSLHAPGDTDWVKVTVSADRFYAIDVRVPPTSTADVALEIYESCEPWTLSDSQAPAFASDIHLTYSAPATATHYIKVHHQSPHVYGEDAVYHLAVRERAPQVTAGHVIIVAGRAHEQDPVQDNIHHVTDAVYRLARENGCNDGQITYLAHDDTLTGVDAPATSLNLQQAIAEAAQAGGPGRPLTLYMMDHGGIDRFYLNQADVITPTQLDTWLQTLQSTWLAEASVVIDACHSGSFITALADAPRPYALIASTKAEQLAYASQKGAVFSDAFIDALRRGDSLAQAFDEGTWATALAHPGQQHPQVEGDGDGIPNQAQDTRALAGRVFACSDPGQASRWAPYIKEVLTTSQGLAHFGVWSEVRDDRQVTQVWAEVYPPSYSPPTDTHELVQPNVPTVTLSATSVAHIYSGTVPLAESGAYRMVLYARDDQGLISRPYELRIDVLITHIYLPLVVRAR